MNPKRIRKLVILVMEQEELGLMTRAEFYLTVSRKEEVFGIDGIDLKVMLAGGNELEAFEYKDVFREAVFSIIAWM